VFDTVASIASCDSLAFVAMLAFGFIAVASLICWLFFASFWCWFAGLKGLAVVVALIAYLVTHIKVALSLEGYKWWQTFHLTEARMKFYDTQLNPNVGWARHALAIDEHRADFDRVRWGSQKDSRTTLPEEPDWLQQVWFAGNHSDIGGSYPENESRLSDVSLQWNGRGGRENPGRSQNRPFGATDVSFG
jgi:Uncharacterized alpha/beta hydrolase domain (DUF2235)